MIQTTVCIVFNGITFRSISFPVHFLSFLLLGTMWYVYVSFLECSIERPSVITFEVCVAIRSFLVVNIFVVISHGRRNASVFDVTVISLVKNMLTLTHVPRMSKFSRSWGMQNYVWTYYCCDAWLLWPIDLWRAEINKQSSYSVIMSEV